jgi:hypothetical protein
MRYERQGARKRDRERERKRINETYRGKIG